MADRYGYVPLYSTTPSIVALLVCLSVRSGSGIP